MFPSVKYPDLSHLLYHQILFSLQMPVKSKVDYHFTLGHRRNSITFILSYWCDKTISSYDKPAKCALFVTFSSLISYHGISLLSFPYITNMLRIISPQAARDRADLYSVKKKSHCLYDLIGTCHFLHFCHCKNRMSPCHLRTGCNTHF